MNRSGVLGFLILTLACSRATPVPRDTQLWRLESAWEEAGDRIHTARAAIISFRSSNEYVEIHTPIIERADGTVYIMAGGQRTAAIGEWEQRGSKVEVTRKKVVGVPCGRVTFTVTGKSVSDNSRTYSPVTRLVAPEFETLVNAAKQAGAKCADD